MRQSWVYVLTMMLGAGAISSCAQSGATKKGTSKAWPDGPHHQAVKAQPDQQGSANDSVPITVQDKPVGLIENLSGCIYRPGKSDKGKPSGTLYGSTVLTERSAIENGAIWVRFNGSIGAVGDFDLLRQQYPNAARLDCRGKSVLSPGWINAHEHTAFSWAFPDPKLAPIYVHRDEWLRGLNDKAQLPSPQSFYYKDGDNPQANARLAWVELRHALSGTTTLAGTGGVPGIIANVNLHKYPGDPEVYDYEANLTTFPFSFTTFEDHFNRCQRAEPRITPQIDANLQALAYVPHIGEGARDNCVAGFEVDQFLHFVEQQNDSRRYAMIHGVAATDDDFARMAAADVTLIWSPRSNLALYGETLDIQSALAAGVKVALGTDWSPSGSYDMSQEFICAGNFVANSKQIWQMATANASYALGLESVIGRLQSGLQGDFFIAPKAPGQDPYEAAVNATPESLLGVWQQGQPLTLSAEFYRLLQQPARASLMNCQQLSSLDRMVCLDLSALKLTWQQLQTINLDAVPLMGNYQRQASCLGQ